MTINPGPIIQVDVIGARGENLFDTVRRLGLGGATSASTDEEAAEAYVVWLSDNWPSATVTEVLAASEAAIAAAAVAGSDLWSRPHINVASAPPGSPVIGDRYLVAHSGVSGAFTSHTDEVAQYNGSSWLFSGAPKGGQYAYNTTTKTLYQYSAASGWVRRASKYIEANNFSSLSSADTFASGASRILLIDEDVTLGSDTTFTAKVRMDGAVITTGSHALNFNGGFSADFDTVCFEKAGTGVITIKGCSEINIRWFAPTIDGATDDTNPFKRADASGLPLRLPAGSYAVNFIQTASYPVRGAGSKITKLIPKDTDVAAVTFRAHTPIWTWSAPWEDITFDSEDTTLGVGFTFGRTDWADYVADDELGGALVSFHRCRFANLGKGVQRLFGNIGTKFIDCEFEDNYFDTYSLSSDSAIGSGRATMHCGNLFFDKCHSIRSVCAHFIDNGNVDGFGQIVLTGYIFEQCLLNIYMNNAANAMISPLKLNDCWVESCGALAPGAPGSIAISKWSAGADVGQNVAPCSYMLDGAYITSVIDGGFATGISLLATQSKVRVTGMARFESNSSFGGQPCVVTSPLTSVIEIEDHICDVGGVNVSGMLMTGAPLQVQNTDAFGPAEIGRANLIPARSSVLTGHTIPGGSVDFTTAVTTTGVVKTGTQQTDGELLGHCNEFSGTWSGSQFSSCATVNLSAGWWVYSVAVKCVTGSPTLFVWDQSAHQIAQIAPPSADSKWHTYGGMFYLASGTPGVWLDISDSHGVSTTFRISAFQLRRFSTYGDAVAFLKSRAFAN